MANYHDAHILALRGALLAATIGIKGAVDAAKIASFDAAELAVRLANCGITADEVVANQRANAEYWRSNGIVSAVSAAPVGLSPAAVQTVIDAAVNNINADILRLSQNDRDILANIANINDNIVDVNKRLESAVNQIGRDIQSVSRAPVIDAESAVADAVDKAFGKFRSLVENNQAEQIVADAVAIRVVDRKSALEVFGVDIRDAAGEPVLVNVFNHPEAPPVDDSYIWPEEALRYALLAQTESVNPSPVIPPNLWLAGDRGTGKTQFATQFAARTGCQLVRINFDRHIERLDFIGGKGLVNGETVFQKAAFLLGYVQTATVILLDEIGFASAGNIANLQALLEPNAEVAFDGFKFRRASGVVVFAADNTTGNRDDTGRFKGVQEQNSALLDRFPFTVTFDFLPPNIESGLIQKRTGASPKLADNIVRVLGVARQQTQTGEIIDAPSLRQAFALAAAINSGIPPEKAWVSAISNKSPSESRTALDAIALSFFQSFN